MANLQIVVNAVDNATGVLRGVGDITTGIFQGIGQAAAGALGKAASSFLDFAQDSFAGALEAQKGMDEFSSALKRAGDTAPITAQAAAELQDKFKNLVGGSDDMVLAMQTVGLRFDKIGKDIFPRFIEQSADLATVLKIEPTKAAEILGKTLQDLSTDGTASLGKLKLAGVQFTGAQEEQIKKLIESGKIAEAQTVLMNALAETTGGAAADAAATGAGQWAIFKETIADAGEGVALALLPTLNKLAADILPKLTPFVETLASGFSYLVKTLASGDIRGLLEEFNPLEFIAQAFGADLPKSFMGFDKALGDVMRNAIDWVVNQGIPAIQNFAMLIITNWPSIQAAIVAGWAAMQPALQAVGDFIFTVLIPALQQAVAWVQTNWPAIQATISGVMTQIQTVISTVLTGIQTFWATWGDEISALAQRAFDNVQLFFSVFTAAFAGDWKKVGETLRVIWDGMWASIQEITNNAISWFTSQDWGAIGTNIMQGIANGINAGAQWIMDAAMKAVKAAVEVVKGFLGIQSPSKVFAGIGANMMLGMAQGVDKYGYAPAAATAQAAYATTVSVGAINVNGAGNPNMVAAAVRRELEGITQRADNRARI